VNSVSLIGRLGRDPETRHTQGGKTVTNFSVAVDEGFGDRKQTYWIPVVAWEKTAEAAGKYLKKGSQVAVEGRLQVRSWDDKEGNKRTTTEVVANRLDFLTKPPSSQSEQEFDGPAPDDSDTPF
jgi:single-strand DNA-binding protein